MNTDGASTRTRGDNGYTMPMVMLVTMIAIAIGVALATSIIFTTNQVSLGRERVQARGAAEAGIDIALAAIEQSQGSTVPCSLSGTSSSATNDGPFPPSYTVSISYRDASGAELACSPGAGTTSPPGEAVITSVGASAPGIVGGQPAERTMEAAVRLRAGTASWADTFGKAVFSQSSVVLDNRWSLLGANADFYTGGNFDCRNSSRFEGSVYGQGTGSLTNSCQIVGDLWTKGAITTSTSGISVGGSVKSSTGGLTMGNNPVPIGGNIVLAGALVSSNGRQPTVGGTISQNLGTFENPPEQTFPRVTFDQADWTEDGWDYLGWRDYIAGIRTVPPAASWWTNSSANFCHIAKAGWSLNKAMVTPVNKTVVDARASGQCDSGRLEFSNNNELKLRNDFTIIASNFVHSGNLTITSVDASGNPSTEPRILRIIVPWTTGESCAASPSTTMSFANSTTISSSVSTFLYTSGNLEMSNLVTFKGQIYGCKVTPHNNMTLTFEAIGGPAESDGQLGSNYEADVLYKRDS